jgi:hypothetical protein
MQSPLAKNPSPRLLGHAVQVYARFGIVSFWECDLLCAFAFIVLGAWRIIAFVSISPGAQPGPSGSLPDDGKKEAIMHDALKRHALMLLVVLAGATLLSCSLTSRLLSPQEGVEEQGGQEAPGETPAGKEQPTSPLPSVYPSSESDLASLLQAGQIELEQIEANMAEIQGPVLSVTLANPGDEEVEVVIPCGLIFEPDEDLSVQKMMVIQELSASIAPHDQVTLEPYVICIESDQSGPSEGVTYIVGHMAEGDLLQLAQCVCQQTLEDEFDPFSTLGLQFAVWITADGMNFDEFVEDIGQAQGALGQMFGQELGGQLGEGLQQMLSIIEAPAQDWLDRCEMQSP